MPESNLVRVTNNCARLLHLPDKVVATTADEGPRITGIGTGGTLYPGGNNVDARIWADAKKNKTVASWLHVRVRNGENAGKPYVEEGGDVNAPEGVPAPGDLLGYGQPAAMAMIEGEDDARVVGKWLEAEQRGPVKAALERRLDALTAPSRQAAVKPGKPTVR